MMLNIKDLIWKILFKGDVKYDTSDELERHIDIIQDLNNMINSLKAQIEENQNEIGALNDALEYLQQELNDNNIEKPDFLNNVMPYQPKSKIVTKTGSKQIVLQPTHIYSVTPHIKMLADKYHLRTLYQQDKKACAMKIWEYVINALTYEFDDGEDWRFSTISLAYTKGDCEDGTILFLDLAKEAGFKANEVFNACGYVRKKDGSKFGHSYPIVNWGEGWYIFESTLDTLPSKPMKLLGSNYGAEWGLCNWKFGGRLKNNQIQI